MSDFKVNLDISSLSQYLDNFAKDLVKDLEKGIRGLATSAHSHIKEEARKKITKYELPIYEENLSQARQIDSFLWEIELIGKGAEIENGQPPRDMKPALLKEGKITKDGKNKFRIIPMTQGKESKSLNTETLAKNEELINSIKGFLKAQNPRLSYSGIEKHTIIDPVTGSPKRVPKLSSIGPDGHPRPLHVFDIPSRIPGKGNTEQLARLHIFQVQNKNGNAKKVMTTFRTVTDKDNQKDKWFYPAQGKKEIFEETKTWAEEQWMSEWLPKILQKYQGK